ncbi:hypothetical protein ONZ45_g13966 [Pleurotus djamor]|nr:hypothetical protein ONZ45_g13966 [Pleurotus djamor]
MLLNSISSPIHAFRLGQEVPNPHPGPDDMEKGITDSPAVPSSANHPGVGDVAAPPSLIIVIDQPAQQPTRSTSDNASPGSSLRSPVLADARRSPHSKNKPQEVTLNIREAKSVTGSPKAASTALTQLPLNVEDLSPQTASLTSSLRPPPVQRTPTRSQPRQGVTMLASHQRTLSVHGAPQLGDQAKFQNYGGFPGPLNVTQKAIQYISPKTYAKLERTLTISSTQTITGVNENGETALTPISGGGPSPHTVRRPGYPSPLHDGQPRISEEGNAMDRFISGMNAKVVSWLSFPLTVGRNSDIHVETLTDEQIEEVGGAEYRALRLLSYLVPSYFVLTQLFAYLLFAPWLSVTHTYDGVFEAQPRLVQKPWFALFQVMGAYTGGRLSLVDLGMVPFQSAYLMMGLYTSKLLSETSYERHGAVALMFVILAGNNALPIFVIEWVAFEVLNIGLPAFEALSVGPRTIAGLFQGLSARTSGFAIVPIANLAPAVQFMYVILMYIAVYPVALSIRSTNVYEEKSLGIFQVPPDEKDQEPTNLESLPPRERVGKYLDWHLRRQVSNDMWWLVWSVFFIAIIERGSIMDENKKWFDMFRVLFELVSAFGGIGLTLGVPYDNFSFCGAMKPLSKLIIIVVMVRGRHRGLPLAVDRAILLPTELNRHDWGTVRGRRDGAVKRHDPSLVIPEFFGHNPSINYEDNGEASESGRSEGVLEVLQGGYSVLFRAPRNY